MKPGKDYRLATAVLVSLLIAFWMVIIACFILIGSLLDGRA